MELLEGEDSSRTSEHLDAGDNARRSEKFAVRELCRDSLQDEC